MPGLRSVGGWPGFPVYRDEFVLRHSRRRAELAAFETVLGLGALHEPTTCRRITRRDRAAARANRILTSRP